MKQEARRVLLTSKCTVYLPLSMQSPSVNWGTPSTCVTRFSSWHGCVCVCGGGGDSRGPSQKHQWQPLVGAA